MQLLESDAVVSGLITVAAGSTTNVTIQAPVRRFTLVTRDPDVRFGFNTQSMIDAGAIAPATDIILPANTPITVHSRMAELRIFNGGGASADVSLLREL